MFISGKFCTGDTKSRVFVTSFWWSMSSACQWWFECSRWRDNISCFNGVDQAWQYKQKEMPRKTTVTYKITSYVSSGKITSDLTSGKYRVMVFNDFFNNISVISWLRTWVNIKLPHVSSGKYKITSCLIR